MSPLLLALLASVPILAILFLLVGLRWPATRAMGAAWAITLALAVSVWQTPANFLAAANVKGLTTAFEIISILFGALVLLFTLREAGALSSLTAALRSVSPDRRVQAIIVAWFLGAFIEGVAAFGTPAALLAPLLVSMGFPAMAAVFVCLLGNATAVSFGPVGMATILGLGTALNSPETQQTIAQSGQTLPEFIRAIGAWTAVIHGVIGFAMPLIIVSFMTRLFGAARKFSEGLAIWPYALLASCCYVLVYVGTAWLFGPEFPSLFAGLGGLALLVPATRAGFLTPKKIWDFPPVASWDSKWVGTRSFVPEAGRNPLSLSKAVLPYLIVAIVLVVSRVDAIGLRPFLRGIAIPLREMFGTPYGVRWEPLMNPGFFPFLPVALIAIPWFGLTRTNVKVAWKDALRAIAAPAGALLFTVPLVEMMQAGHSPNGWPSMPLAIADVTAASIGAGWQFVAPFVGILGTFIAGSNAVSNMLFGLFQFSVAGSLGLSRTIVLALQNVGGSLGVVVCVFKIVTASSTVGLKDAEGTIMRQTVVPLLITGLIAGLTGTVLLALFGGGLF